MMKERELSLPEPVAAYFVADRRGGPAVARCFINEGKVIDEGQTYIGLAAIEAWKTATSAQSSYVAEPGTFEKNDHTYIVTGRVTGNFPGSPVNLQYIFALAHGKITSLEIKP
jgi:hypothetical protein